MAIKVGDIVRFLNSVGGGKVTRIDGQIAYVDEDGFETPVLLRECVVVTSGDTFYKSEVRNKPAPPSPPADEPLPPSPAPQPALPALEETPEGELLNIVLAFEPADIKKLSRTSFDAYLVNDSNYYIYTVISSRADDHDKWTVRFDGLIEPAVQEFVFELNAEDLPDVDRLSVQIIPFKRDSAYARKAPVDFQQKLDTTKFARLHCFDKNPYFDAEVLAVQIVKDDKVQGRFEPKADEIKEAVEKQKMVERPRKRTAVSKPANRRPEKIEVDLHAGELLDTLNGLSKADILNYQVDTFRRVMDENLKFPGTKIVFIHGKGEGVLRQAIMKELNYRYKGHDVADASFREYGFGATQVTIRRVKTENK